MYVSLESFKEEILMYVCNRVGGICRGLLNFRHSLRSKFTSTMVINFLI
jgi:hypothetical protein